MSFTELLPAVRVLSRRDKALLVKELFSDLAQEDEAPVMEFPIWSPHEAHDVAATLLQLLEREKASAT